MILNWQRRAMVLCDTFIHDAQSILNRFVEWTGISTGSQTQTFIEHFYIFQAIELLFRIISGTVHCSMRDNETIEPDVKAMQS